MPKTRKINRRAKKSNTGKFGPVHTQSPKGSGVPTEREPAKATMKNASMTKPGSGTRGHGKGAR